MKPELECFDLGHIANAEPLVDMGALQAAAPVQLHPGRARRRRRPRRRTWPRWLAPSGARTPGRSSASPRRSGGWWARRSRWAGNIRVGLEDNFYLDAAGTQMAKGNGAAGGEGGPDGPRHGPRADEPGRGAEGAVAPPGVVTCTRRQFRSGSGNARCGAWAGPEPGAAPTSLGTRGRRVRKPRGPYRIRFLWSVSAAGTIGLRDTSTRSQRRRSGRRPRQLEGQNSLRKLLNYFPEIVKEVP